MKSLTAAIVFLGLLTFFSMVPPNFASQIVVIVDTDKPTYSYRELVHVFSDIYYEGQPVSGGLVAIQVDDANNTIMVRTATTASNLSNFEIEIISVIPCDQYGRPKNNFNKNSNAYFNITIKNNLPFSRNITLTVTAYDIDSTPLGIATLQTAIAGESVLGFIPSILLPEWSSTGNATAYVSILTNWPKNQGYPYCPEKSASFTIDPAYSSSSQTIHQLNPSSAYSVTFRLPPHDPPYNCTYLISAGAFYQGYKGFANTTFTVEYQVVGDFNSDHKIDIFDVVPVAFAYNSKPGDPEWDPTLDVAPSGEIDIYDVVKVAIQYGTTY